MGNGESALEPDLQQHLPATQQRFIGLVNEGNTCFCNALVQVLFRIEAFREPVVQYWMCVKNGQAPRDERSMMDALGDLFLRMRQHPTRTGTLSADDFLRRLRNLHEDFEYGRQHDVHELYSSIANDCEDTIKRLRASKRASAVAREALGQLFPAFVGGTFVNGVFEGLVCNETCCSVCRATTSRDEAFLALSLEIEDGYSVAACIRRFVAPEVLTEPFRCDSTACAGQFQPSAEKRTLIKRSPRVLVLHLKRFRYLPSRRGFIKLHHRILFGEELKLRSAQDAPNALYKLKGFVAHVGSSAGSGHYVSVVRVEGKWFLFNDEDVQIISADRFSSFYGGGSASCYLLLYELADA